MGFAKSVRTGAAAGLLGFIGTGAMAEDAPAPAHSEKIEVTGTNVKRLDTETGLPVQTITRADIDRMGVTTAEELLDKVSATNAGGHNLAIGLGDGGTPGLSAVSLRGLGSSNTLVLLNGRRLANFAFNSSNGGGTVNVGQIPLAAVERVEILRDGASAIYGTDAIGGVINFILRKDYRGVELTANGGWTQDGGGNQQKYSATAGYGDVAKDRFNVLAMLEYEKDQPLNATQRSFASTGIRPDLGVARGSFSTIPANFRYAGTLVNPAASAGCAPGLHSFQVNTNTGLVDPSQAYCIYDFSAALQITPASERTGFYGRGVWQVLPDHQAYFEYHRTWTSTLFAASETPVMDQGAGTMYYPAGGMYYPAPFTLPDGTVVNPHGNLFVRWRLQAAGLRTDRVKTDEYSWATGMQGVLAGWDYDAYVSGAKSHVVDDYVSGYVRISLMAQAMQTGLIDVFSNAPLTPQAQALIDAASLTGKVRDSDSTVSSGAVKASREIYEGKYGPVSVAVGFEDRKETLEERPQEVLYTGDILGGGGAIPPTTRASRVTASLFGEIDIPLLKNLDAQLALRYDHFSDFGNSVNPKVALRWTPVPQLLMRASYGTGFRAPTLTDLFLPTTQGLDEERYDPARCTNTPDGAVPNAPYVSPDECLGVNVRTGGNPAAQPEKSHQWSFGAVWEPVAGNSIGIDYWTIRRRDSLQPVAEETVFDVFAVNDPTTAQGHFVRAPRLGDGSCQGDAPGLPTPAGVPCPISYANILIENLGKYNVSGLDLAASYRYVSPAWGRFNFHIDGTYFIQYRYQLWNGSDYFDNVGKAANNGAVTRWKHYASIDWSRGPWGATFSQNFMLGYRDEDGQQTTPRRVGNTETYDIQGTWQGWKTLKASFGIRNIFNRDPPASRQGETFQVGYDARYTSPLGRAYYLTLKYAFK